MVAHPWDLRRDPIGPVLDAARPDVVFHLAGTVDPRRDPDLYPLLLADVAATDQLARACLTQDLRLVTTGTCEAYGDGPAPFVETQLAQPVSPYSATKLAASNWVLTLARTQGLRATVTRPFLTYGPGQRGDRLVPTALRAARDRRPFPMTAGTQTRELTYIDDTVRGLILAAAPAAEGHLVNLCGGAERSVLEWVRTIYRVAGAPLDLIQPGARPTRAGESVRFVGDPSKARALLGYAPTVPPEEGLRRCLAALGAA